MGSEIVAALTLGSACLPAVARFVLVLGLAPVLESVPLAADIHRARGFSEMADHPVLHVITGPTAVGKTAYALDYAERIGAEIVSCDASLVYRGMDIGTAKPTAEERARVPHHLIDLVPVGEPYDVGRYTADAVRAVAEIESRGRPVVVTGGSGFYLKAFFGPVTDGIEVPAEVRARVASIERDEGVEGLLALLRALNPEGTGDLDIRNPRRVAKALERCLATGRSTVELARAFAAMAGPFAGYPVNLILLERDPEELRQRIARRVGLMLEAGLVDEVRRLREEGIERNPSAAAAIGYREVIEHLDGRLERQGLAEAIAAGTRRLARKQRIWFRTQLREPDERVVL